MITKTREFLHEEIPLDIDPDLKKRLNAMFPDGVGIGCVQPMYSGGPIFCIPSSWVDPPPRTVSFMMEQSARDAGITELEWATYMYYLWTGHFKPCCNTES